MKATAVLARQHRRIEQLVGALEHERFLRRPLLVDLSDELTAHFGTVRELLHGAPARSTSTYALNDLDLDVEADAGDPTMSSRMRTDSFSRARDVIMDLSRIADVADNDDPFVAKLAELRAVVAEHVLLHEGALLRAVEALLDPAAQEALGRSFESLHASALLRCRSCRSPISSKGGYAGPSSGAATPRA